MEYSQNSQIIHSVLKPFFLCIVNPRLKIQAKWTVFVFQGHDKCHSNFFSGVILFSQDLKKKLSS